MDNAPLIPFVVTSFAATVAEVTGIEPTITRQPRRRWRVELRTDRIHATHWFRDDWLTGATVSASGHSLEVDGVVQDPVPLEVLADLIRYPDGKPGTLHPVTEELDPESAPRPVRQTHEAVQSQLAEHPQIRVRIGRRSVDEIEFALDLSEGSGLRFPFRKTERGWVSRDEDLVVVVDGIDYSRKVSGGGLAAAVKVLLTAKGQPAAKGRPAAPGTIGTASAAQVTPTSVQVRNDTVFRI